MTKSDYTIDELKGLDEHGKAIAEMFEGTGITGVSFAAGDDEACYDCGLRVYPDDPRYATSSAHEETCPHYQWDKKS